MQLTEYKLANTLRNKSSVSASDILLYGDESLLLRNTLIKY